MSAGGREYPPQDHVLRHLRLSHRHDADGSVTAAMPVLPDLCDADGRLRLGAVATLVDSVAGRHSVARVAPDWVATMHLGIVLTARAEGDFVTAACTPVRVGRNHVVAEVAVSDAAGTPVARSTCTYVRLGRRADTPEAGTSTRSRAVDYREEKEVSPRPPLDEYLRISPVPGRPLIELPLHRRIVNSFGSLQGGVSVVVAEVMAEHMAAGNLDGAGPAGRPLSTAAGRPRCTAADVHYLAPARIGPIRATGETLTAGAHSTTVRVRCFDVGNADRLIQLATATAEFPAVGFPAAAALAPNLRPRAPGPL